MAKIDIITKEDFNSFKDELLNSIKELTTQTPPTKKWLRTSDVKELFNLSEGTLKNLRAKGELKYTKLSGMIYYDHDDFLEILEQNKR
jgi:hypothetical protein|tara:strand:+ start:290 stop:553 length:264 start_codon:yes stop_codon:yes gene_type:complete